jgi:hypothetical protein
MLGLLRVLRRSFAVRPAEPLHFVEGRYKVLDASAEKRVNTKVGVVALTLMGLLGGNILLGHASMGWLALLGKLAGLGFASSYTMNAGITRYKVIRNLYLLSDGKRIEVELESKSRTFDISSIDNMFDTEEFKEILDAGQLYLRFKEGPDYIISLSSFIIDKEVLKAILRGHDIETGFVDGSETIDI